MPDPTPVETPYGTLYVDPEELVIGRLLQANGQLPDISQEVAFFRKYLKPGDTAIDVGANYGLFTLALAQIVGETGHVKAIEPNKDMLQFWKKTAKANVGADHPHVEYLWGASGSRLTTGELRKDPRGSGGSQMHPGSLMTGESITIMPLDMILMRPIKAIKIDAEGMDVDVLLGAEKILREDRPVVIFEWNPEAMQNLGKDPLEEFVQLFALGDRADYIVLDLDEKHAPDPLLGNLAFLPDELLES